MGEYGYQLCQSGMTTADILNNVLCSIYLPFYSIQVSKKNSDQGMYEDSIRYYVRALAMNPKADNAWQYLRISLR